MSLFEPRLMMATLEIQHSEGTLRRVRFELMSVKALELLMISRTGSAVALLIM